MKKGFTLVELIISMAIMAIVGAIILSVFQIGIKVSGKQQVQNDVQDNSRRVINSISSDIRKGVLIKTFADFSIPHPFNAGSFDGYQFPADVVNNIDNYFNNSATGYKPLLFIDAINGEKYMYVLISNADGTKTLNRIIFAAGSNDAVYSCEKNKIDGTISFSGVDQKRMSYYNDSNINVNFNGSTNVINIVDKNSLNITPTTETLTSGGTTTVPFCYTQDNNIFFLQKNQDTGSNVQPYKTVKLNKDTIILSSNPYTETITDTIKATSGIADGVVIAKDDTNDIYNIEVNTYRTNVGSGADSEKSLETNVAQVRYGGDISGSQ